MFEKGPFSTHHGQDFYGLLTSGTVGVSPFPDRMEDLTQMDFMVVLGERFRQLWRF
jgi:hypothetical protein